MCYIENLDVEHVLSELKCNTKIKAVLENVLYVVFSFCFPVFFIVNFVTFQGEDNMTNSGSIILQKEAAIMINKL